MAKAFQRMMAPSFCSSARSPGKAGWRVADKGFTYGVPKGAFQGMTSVAAIRHSSSSIKAARCGPWEDRKLVGEGTKGVVRVDVGGRTTSNNKTRYSPQQR